MLFRSMNDASPLPLCTCNKCTCNVSQRVHQRQQDHRLIQFMMKLSERFSGVRGNIMMQVPLPNVSTTFRMFSQEERHQEISQSTTESLAFLADNRRHFDSGNRSFTQNYQYSSGTQGFGGNKNVNVAGNKKNSKYYCTHCKISGHSLERCFKINGYPPGFKNF